MGHQELGLRHVTGEPVLLEVLWSELGDEHRDLPVLDQLVGEPRLASRNLGRYQRQRLGLGRRVERNPPVLLGNPESPQPRGIRLLEDVWREAVQRVHLPFTHAILLNERNNDVVDVPTGGVTHHPLFARQVPVLEIHLPPIQ